MIYSSFLVWQDGSGRRKRSFVVNISIPWKHFPKRSVRMEEISSFTMDLQRGDHLLSMEIKKRYIEVKVEELVCRPLKLGLVFLGVSENEVRFQLFVHNLKEN